MPQLLTVFRMSEDNHDDVDVAILQALLKGNNQALWLLRITGSSAESQSNKTKAESLRLSSSASV